MTGSRYTSSSLWLVDALVVYVVLPLFGATWLLAMWSPPRSPPYTAT